MKKSEYEWLAAKIAILAGDALMATAHQNPKFYGHK
jgi:hypothetical protein